MQELRNGDTAIMLAQMQSGSVDAVITDPPYDELSPNWLDDLFRVVKPGGNVIMFCSPENQFFKPDEILFWIKTPSTKNFQKRCGRFVEMILVKRGERGAFNPLHWSQMTGVYDDRLILPPIHPYEKPLSLIERLIRIYTNPGAVVLDPFCGSGTTLVACVNLRRKAIGIEKDHSRYLLAQDRLLGLLPGRLKGE